MKIPADALKDQTKEFDITETEAWRQRANAALADEGRRLAPYDLATDCTSVEVDGKTYHGIWVQDIPDDMGFGKAEAA